jgi:hypothetical protein
MWLTAHSMAQPIERPPAPDPTSRPPSSSSSRKFPKSSSSLPHIVVEMYHPTRGGVRGGRDRKLPPSPLDPAAAPTAS